MLERREFVTYADMLHFLHENQPEQFAVVNNGTIELAYIAEQQESTA